MAAELQGFYYKNYSYLKQRLLEIFIITTSRAYNIRLTTLRFESC